MINGKKIGLVLSGGGAKGFAHIGVLKVLEQNGIVPDIVVGTSMGSIVGGLYASGLSVDQLLDETKKFKLVNITDINVFNLMKEGIVAGNKLMRYIDKISNDAKIEDFKIKFACVACDVKTCSEYIFTEGKLSVAARTSSSIPGIFAPYRHKNMLLVDGGVLNNNPTNVAYTLGADYVIWVDCIGDAYRTTEIRGIVDILMTCFSALQYRYEKAVKRRYDAKIVISNFQYSYSERTPEGIKNIILSGETEMNKKIKKIKKDLGM